MKRRWSYATLTSIHKHAPYVGPPSLSNSPSFLFRKANKSIFFRNIVMRILTLKNIKENTSKRKDVYNTFKTVETVKSFI